MLRFPVFAFAAGLLFCFPACADKHALVIGINAYENVPQLQKAAGDARAMTEVFKAAGYRVTPLEDASRDTFVNSWSKFTELVKEGDEVGLFFSGHGLQIGAEHFLLMRDAPKAENGEGAVRRQAIQFNELLDDLQAKHPRISLVILDACRNNPYAATGRKGIGGSKGLVPVVPPEGTFVMYSAGANEEALDRLSDADREPVSVYMRNLLPLLKTPGLRIYEVARRVKVDVHAAAEKVQHRQNPAYYDEFRGDFCFAGCSAETADKGTPDLPSTNECKSANPPISCLWRDPR